LSKRKKEREADIPAFLSAGTRKVAGRQRRTNLFGKAGLYLYDVIAKISITV
jgi:hypothetical protein